MTTLLSTRCGDGLPPLELGTLNFPAWVIGAGGAGLLGDPRSAITVFDCSVIGAPWPLGGVAVTVAVLEYDPALSSADVSVWLHV
jgi:hypothetical protein